MEKSIVDALICILGALIALWIVFFQIKQEIKSLYKNGIHDTQDINISSDDILKITQLVLDEMDKRKEEKESQTNG